MEMEGGEGEEEGGWERQQITAHTFLIIASLAVSNPKGISEAALR